MQRSEYIKRILKLIAFVLLFIVFTLMLDFAFEHDEGATERMLSAFSAREDIDTVFVGSSVGEMIDDERYSDSSGESAFNMCTPSQAFLVSLKNLKLAASHHRIKKAILFITFDSLNTDDEWVEGLYDRVVDSSGTLGERISNYLRRSIVKSFSPGIIKTEKSVNVWFPWVNEAEHGFSRITGNLKRRFGRFLRGRRLGYEIEYDLNKNIYETAPEKLSDEEQSLFQKDVSELEGLSLPGDFMKEDRLLKLAEICSFCRNNGIELYVIISPHRSDYYDRFGSFREYSETASDFLEDFIVERGFDFRDAEEDKDLHRVLPDSYFYDWEHIDDKYKDKATDYIYDLLIK